MASYQKTNWQNEPSTTTPVSAANLQKIEDQLERNDLGNPASTASLSQSATYARPSVIVRPRSTDETDDTAAFNEALTEADNLVAIYGKIKVVWQPGRTITSTGGHQRPWGVSVDFSGNTVTHTGDNVFLDCHAAAFDMKNNVGISNIHLIGNAGVNAVGFEVGNSWGFEFRNITIESYASGIGIDVRNKINWSEGLTTYNTNIKYCDIAIRFAGAEGGTNSYGYTRLRELAINVPANGIAIQIGPADPGGQAYFYNSYIEAVVWLEGTNAMVFQIGPDALAMGVRLDITGEGNYTGPSVQNLGGTFQAYGNFNINGTHPVDLTGNNGALAPNYQNTIAPAGTDATYGGALAIVSGYGAQGATFGAGKDVNLAFGWVSGYEFGTQDVFRVYSMPFSASPIGTAAHRRFAVASDGAMIIGHGATASNPITIRGTTGSPNSQYAPGPGSLAMRADAPVRGYQNLYVKASGSGTNTGWVPLQPVAANSTANRPVGLDVGSMYFDVTLNKPVWMGNTGWVDATGASV